MNNLTPFSLSQYGETIYLSSADASGNLTGFITGASFGVSENGVSMGRYATSRGVHFEPLSQTTFGSDTPANLSEFRSGAGAQNAPPRIDPVVINEIMYNPTGGGSEFLEFLKVTGAAVDFSGWKIAGADFTFPMGTSIPAQGLILLLRTNNTSVAAFRTTYQVPQSVPIFAHDFVLENEGEALRLEKPNTMITEPFIERERVRYNDKSPWPTEADGEGPSRTLFRDELRQRPDQLADSPGRRLAGAAQSVCDRSRRRQAVVLEIS